MGDTRGNGRHCLSNAPFPGVSCGGHFPLYECVRASLSVCVCVRVCILFIHCVESEEYV